MLLRTPRRPIMRWGRKQKGDVPVLDDQSSDGAGSKLRRNSVKNLAGKICHSTDSRKQDGCYLLRYPTTRILNQLLRGMRLIKLEIKWRSFCKY
jgi:hypothetical protein